MKKGFLSSYHSFLTSVSSFFIAYSLNLQGGRQKAGQVLEIHLREEEVPLFIYHIHTHNPLHFYNSGDQIQASPVELLDDL